MAAVNLFKPQTGMSFEVTKVPKADVKPRATCPCVGRKLPRTPAEYAELSRNACVAESSQSATDDIAPGKGNSNTEYPDSVCKLESKPPKIHIKNHLGPSRTPPNPGSIPLDNSSLGTHSEASEYDEGTSGIPPYIEVLQGGTEDDVKQQNTLSMECFHVANHATGFGDKDSSYEKLNPETMWSYEGSKDNLTKKANSL